MARKTTTIRALPAVGLGVVLILCIAFALGAASGAGASTQAPDTGDDANVSEERYVEEAPEEGDEYYEAEAEDGSWISYSNPRDRYRDPMVGNASGKVCVTLRNEAGEVVAGESIPDTAVTIPTPSLSWHSHADPMTVEFPLTDNYDRPLDSDQFGTTPDLPQGDGFMDSHCIEYHGPPDNATIEYGEARIDGEHADDVEVAGYIQQAHEEWDTDVDAIEDAVSYEEAGGEWTMETNRSHGQVTVVLQLQGADQEHGGESQKDRQQETATAEPTSTATETTATETTANETTTVEGDVDGEDGGSILDQTAPGIGVVVVAVVLSVAALVRRRE